MQLNLWVALAQKDYDLMTQRTTDRSKRDAGVAAGRFGYGVAGLNAAFLISSLENVKGHPVLDAASHVELLGLGIDDTLFSSEQKVYDKQRCVADHVLQLFEAIWQFADRCCCSRQRIDLSD